MTRTTSFIATALLTGVAAFGASRLEVGTYVSGNISGVSPNTGGTLDLSGDKAMYFRSGLSSVPVPYASIKSADLGVVKTHGHNDPAYKVWTLHKRFMPKPHTQDLTVNFRGEDGEDKTMTLEIAEPVAAGVLTAITESRLGPGHKIANQWWGDDFWKTTRNSDKWKQTSATTSAQ